MLIGCSVLGKISTQLLNLGSVLVGEKMIFPENSFSIFRSSGIIKNGELFFKENDFLPSGGK